MQSSSLRIIDRVYAPPVQRALQWGMYLGLAVYGVVLYLILTMPELGLRLLWFAAIPLAPMILLVAPNAWVSVCPVSTVQTLSQRMGRKPSKRLPASATDRLQTLGWALMLVGIPTRHLVFNTVGWATFWTAVTISGLALVIGFTFRSLSGWCVGACPIRPIEVLYGQFALDRNRPEKCTSCSACISSCLRLVPEKGHKELYRNKWIGNMAMGFPGFVAAYFALDLLGICQTEHSFFLGQAYSPDWLQITLQVYGTMFAGFAISWLFFSVMKGRFLSGEATFRLVALSAFSAYYLGVAPEICEAWHWPMEVAPLLLIPPLAAMIWALTFKHKRPLSEPPPVEA